MSSFFLVRFVDKCWSSTRTIEGQERPDEFGTMEGGKNIFFYFFNLWACFFLILLGNNFSLVHVQWKNGGYKMLRDGTDLNLEVVENVQQKMRTNTREKEDMLQFQLEL